MGVVEPYQTDNPAEGRVAVTGKDADRFNFKVPTLRNVELTYPYFHDGAYWELEKAVDVMARLQLGRQLNDEEINNVVAFLKTLTGDQPQLTLPILPPSTNDTPRPPPFRSKRSPVGNTAMQKATLGWPFHCPLATAPATARRRRPVLRRGGPDAVRPPPAGWPRPRRPSPPGTRRPAPACPPPRCRDWHRSRGGTAPDPAPASSSARSHPYARRRHQIPPAGPPRDGTRVHRNRACTCVTPQGTEGRSVAAMRPFLNTAASQTETHPQGQVAPRQQHVVLDEGAVLTRLVIQQVAGTGVDQVIDPRLAEAAETQAGVEHGVTVGA